MIIGEVGLELAKHFSGFAVVEYVAVNKRMFGLVAVVGPTPTAIRGCSTKEHSASTVAIETKDNEAPSAAK